MFELLNPQTPLQQHLQNQGPARATIYAYDSRRTINQRIRNLYSLNNGEIMALENSSQGPFSGTYDNFKPDYVTYIRITGYQHYDKTVGVRFNRPAPATPRRASPIYEPDPKPPQPPSRVSSPLPPRQLPASAPLTQSPNLQQTTPQPADNGPLVWVDLTDPVRRGHHPSETYDLSDLIEVHPLGLPTPVLIERNGGSTTHVYHRIGDVSWRIERLEMEHEKKLQELTELEEAGERDKPHLTDAERAQINMKIIRYDGELNRLRRRIGRLGGGGEAMEE